MYIRTALCGFCLAGVKPALQAQQIYPLIYELGTSGEQSRQELSVANTGNSPVAFEIIVTRRSYAENGQAIDVPENEKLIVEPAAVWVEPGASRKVSVRYTGPAPIDRSEMYLVTFRQAPVQLAKDERRDGISLQYEFATIAHVVPANASPEIAVASLAIDDGVAGVSISNRGRRYGRMDSGVLTLGGQTACLELSGDALADRYRATWILPGEIRLLKIELPQGCPRSGLRADWRIPSAKPGK